MAPVFPVQPGNPDYSTGSSSQYIPAVYSALLVKKFYPSTVWGEISNTDYEGDIKSAGDTVYIRTRPTIDTFKYRKGMVLPIQNPESPYTTLKIDQGEGFSFALDKVDEFQADIKLMDVWAEDAAEQMKQVIDKNVLQAIATGAAPLTNTAGMVNGGTTTKGTSISLGTSGAKADVSTLAAAASMNEGDWLVDRILYYGQLMDENNLPDSDRFLILPAWAMQKMKSVNSKLGQVYVTGDASAPARNGKVGGIDRFKIFMSNNLYNDSVIFGHKYGLTFATQITESRIIDNPFSFGKMMQGLQVYGFNIVKTSCVGVDFLVP